MITLSSGGHPAPALTHLPKPPKLNTMHPSRSAVRTTAGTICTILGAAASIRFALALTAGTVNAVDYTPILLPLGIALLEGNRFWVWMARVHLFVLALLSSATILVFLLMSDESRSVTFELHDNIGRISGGGLILLTQGIFLAAILWVYFSIFAGPIRFSPRSPQP